MHVIFPPKKACFYSQNFPSHDYNTNPSNSHILPNPTNGVYPISVTNISRSILSFHDIYSFAKIC